MNARTVDTIVFATCLVSSPISSVMLITFMVRLFVYGLDNAATILFMNIASLFGIISLACFVYIFVCGIAIDIRDIRRKKRFERIKASREKEQS